MGSVVGQILPLAVGVALSPFPIIAVILMLFTPRARSNGSAFAVGWVAGLTVAVIVVLALSSASDTATSDSGGPSTTVGWLKSVLGVLLLFLALRRWRRRPPGGETPEMPRWMSAIDGFTPVKSLALGAALSGLNPKNLALTVAAAATIAAGGLSTGQEVAVSVIFIVLASITVVTPVVAFLLMGERAEGALTSAKDWMAANNDAVMAVVLVVFGIKLIGDGIGILT
ncbi:MAG: GAP family protein [Acidimicrobiia bacterium]|nr:GAP family protein [Acidimicrobiia bacterium]